MEYNRGKAHTAYILTVKLANWQQLPWLLAGIAHHYEDRARECAAKVVHQYDASADEDVLHHRLACRL